MTSSAPGPSRWSAGNATKQMVLERNPNYWRKDADGTQLPYLERLIFQPIENSSARLDALQAGSVDAGHWGDASSVAELRKDSSEFGLVGELPAIASSATCSSTSPKPPFDDPVVRKHLAMAIDHDALVDVGGSGVLDLAVQPYDSAVMGYRDDVEPPKYDAEAASALLRGEGPQPGLHRRRRPDGEGHRGGGSPPARGRGHRRRARSEGSVHGDQPDADR